MTPEQKLDLLTTILVEHCKANDYPDSFPETVMRHLDTWSKDKIFPGIAAIATLMLEERAKLDAQKTGGRTQLAALKRIAKSAEKRVVDKAYQGGWVDDDGRFCVSDGRHAVRLMGARFDSIPSAKGGKLLDGIMDTSGENLVPVELPALAECKAWRRTHKGERIITIDGGRRYVDVDLLINMLESLPEAKAMAEMTPISPIWFADDHRNDGVLLPRRPPQTYYPTR